MLHRKLLEVQQKGHESSDLWRQKWLASSLTGVESEALSLRVVECHQRMGRPIALVPLERSLMSLWIGFGLSGRRGFVDLGSRTAYK